MLEEVRTQNKGNIKYISFIDEGTSKWDCRLATAARIAYKTLSDRARQERDQ